MDKKDLIKKAMQNNMILSEKEAEDAINFVEELLGIEIKDTEENEPYATRSIQEMKSAQRQIYSLTDVINEL